MEFWCFPLPPIGPMTVHAEWTAAGIDETSTVVDATLVVDAAARTIVLWDFLDDGSSVARWPGRSAPPD